MLRLLPVLIAIFGVWPASAQHNALETEPGFGEQLQRLGAADPLLQAAKSNLIDCEQGCLTPIEAVTLAFSAGEDEDRKARVLLDVRGGGQSLTGNLGELFFISSHQDYAEFGTVTIAFEARVLRNLLRRARTCGGTLVNGEITVDACRAPGIKDVNMFTMMQALFKRRIVVDGAIRLQWIDSSFGLRNRESNTRGEYEKGYYQPWVWVEDADQISFVYDD